MPKLKDFSIGFTIGFGTGLVTRDFFPNLRLNLRPIAKTALKSTLLIAEKSKEVTIQLGETFEDLIAEVRSDLKRSHKEQESEIPPTESIKPNEKVAS